MGAGPGSVPVAPDGDAVPWMRVSLVWMLIMLVETAHGFVREIFIAPAIGGLRARQLGVALGALIVLLSPGPARGG